MIPIISIVGRGDSGKTTLIEKIIPELAERGYKVGTIKHDVHGFDIDHPGKDSWRHSRAGTAVTAISSPDKVAVVAKVERELTLDELADRYFPGCDLIITEGYKKESKPKIEVVRSEISTELVCDRGQLLLVATDVDNGDFGVPTFRLDDIDGICDIIENNIIKPPTTNH